MSTIEKLREKMQNNPQNWRIEDAERLAKSFGFDCGSGKGSHRIFYHPRLTERLSIPAKRPVKPVYIRKLLDLIEELEGM
jgi:predicted RNA binding protein YcfA (HicA-like mRNA interferase family)